MAGIRERGRAIREYIIAQVASHPKDIAQVSANQFGISRQAINKHLNRLITEGLLAADGTTRNRRYSLAEFREKDIVVSLTENTDEDTVWRREIAPLVSDLPRNTREVWQYGFTEMLNNAIDHSSGTAVEIMIVRTAVDRRIVLADDGEGIFRKITRELQLADERHAVLELAKGKLTTDPDRHTGEGIFFTSRLFDEFNLVSGEVLYSHDWIQETRPITGGADVPGTSVILVLNNKTTRTTKQVFDEYTEAGDYGFSKTVVPVSLVRYGDEALISRSQAKRLLTRFDRFRKVLLDFEGVEDIGQAFADEVFRVFVRANPDVDLVPFNANADVESMIRRARDTT